MRPTNGAGNVPERDTWQTPQNLFDILHAQYKFGFDCCASVENRKTTLFSDDFETIDVPLPMAWMNPPFSKASEMFLHYFKIVDNGVAIYRCDNLETATWQEIIFPNADWVFIPKGRIRYEGMSGSGSRFPSALIGVGCTLPLRLDGCALPLRLDGTLIAAPICVGAEDADPYRIETANQLTR